MTHSKQILSHLKSGKALTAYEALVLFGCFRLAARIHDLREAGHSITTTRTETTSGATIAEYRLEAVTAAMEGMGNG
jgi:hypothetical protein